jgi:hypothetical protein
MAGSGLAAPAPILAAIMYQYPYGHELLFGTFITPAAQRPHHAVELAVVADRAASTW